MQFAIWGGDMIQNKTINTLLHCPLRMGKYFDFKAQMENSNFCFSHITLFAQSGSTPIAINVLQVFSLLMKVLFSLSDIT